MAAQMILGLAILVILHELGHFLAARAFGIRVEKFYLFFDAWGVKLFKYKHKDTEYGIGWLPFGGYVKISGMIDESMDKEAMKKPPQPWEFRSKPAWQRLIVMLAGVVMNLIVGVVILSMHLYLFKGVYRPMEEVNADGIYAYEMARDVGLKTGDKILTINGNEAVRQADVLSASLFLGAELTVDRESGVETIQLNDTLFKALVRKGRFIAFENFTSFPIDSIIPDFPAHKAGLLAGDQVIAIDGVPTTTYGAFREELLKHASDTTSILVLRQGSEVPFTVVLEEEAYLGGFFQMPYGVKHYSASEAMKFGLRDAITMLRLNINGFSRVISGKDKATESLSGPIGIAAIYGGVWNWSNFWYITGIISLILAFMNLLPIPALDGGHAIFLLVEMIIRRPLNEKFMEYIQMVGMFLLLALMVFVVGLDIFKLIF